MAIALISDYFRILQQRLTKTLLLEVTGRNARNQLEALSIQEQFSLAKFHCQKLSQIIL
ncbi:hypothetical protein [Nostoc sp. C117]|uniref:hypothetical protein n=1 Tax=Nostoc sp. C117 TaxID=3349875 RepID=UPI00370D628A